ncbi:MAG TPA: alpha/beta hydrolase, partial [Micromonosporaceae bacterium]|nr:alpha/beta hydrolase [Micromonosporaceae bacterium]
MITYEKLLSADPAAWRAAGRAWQQVSDLVDARAAEVAGTAAGLRRRWSGPASVAAGRAVERVRGDLVGSRPAFVDVDQVLAEYAAALGAARASLVAAVGSAPAGVVVDPGGLVSVELSVQPGEAATRRVAAGRVAAAIEAALALAAAADGQAAHRLAGLAANACSGWTAQPPPYRPAPGAEPADVRRWWDGLDPAQRRWLVQHEARLVGRLDGVPADARDQANRLLLEDQSADLREQRSALLARRPRTLAVLRDLARLRRTLDGIDAIRDRLTAGTGPRAYLLALDPSGDGRSVVAVGNPDRADNVLTYVPGMTSDLPGIDGELDRTYAMATRCAELGPTERTATVLWLNYDAPDFVHEAARAAQAQDAGPALHRFQEGLRATHEGPPAHQAVLGHSYGSLVVGATARDHGLAADSLVFVGSPGVGVDHASQLGLSPSRVWSSTAYDDVIQYGALSPQAWLDRLARAGLSPVATLPLLVGLPSDDLWFGRNPSDPSFGGRIFGSADRGHVGYWDP